MARRKAGAIWDSAVDGKVHMVEVAGKSTSLYTGLDDMAEELKAATLTSDTQTMVMVTRSAEGEVRVHGQTLETKRPLQQVRDALTLALETLGDG